MIVWVSVLWLGWCAVKAVEREQRGMVRLCGRHVFPLLGPIARCHVSIVCVFVLQGLGLV